VTLSFFHDVPPARRVREDQLDVHVAEDATDPRPAVVFVHGGPIPPGHSPRDTDVFRGYGALAAAAGLVGVTFDHRLHSGEHYPQAADDVAAALARTRELPAVDAERVLLWCFSGGGAIAAAWLRDPPPWLRGIAWTYPILAPPPGWPGDVPRFDAVDAVRKHPALPKLLVRVGREIEPARVTQDAFVAAADEVGAALEILTIDHAEHGVEVHPHDADARATVDRAMAWAAATLRG
jgi:alpha-beta hydrolase superfamily lysophospholipase